MGKTMRVVMFFLRFLVEKVANILNYTMTYKDKVLTEELYDIESNEFQRIALEAQKVGTRFGLYTSNQNNGIKRNVKEEIKLGMDNI